MTPVFLIFVGSVIVIWLVAGTVSLLEDWATRSSRKRRTSYLFWFLILGVSIFLVWVAYLFYWPTFLEKSGIIEASDFENVGQYGDGFGAATSLFSGLAFAGLLATLIMQRQELELQRNELENSTAEFMRQRFEATLFSIIELFTDHIENLELEFDDMEPSPGRLRGRGVLEYYASELPAEIGIDEAFLAAIDDREPRRVSPKEQGAQYLREYHRELESDLGPYFRLLYNCIRHIHKSDLEPEEKFKYAKIVRAHLSSHEVKLLMFNCCAVIGKEFRPWVEEYALLKHLSVTTANENKGMVLSYSASAFGGRYPTLV